MAGACPVPAPVSHSPSTSDRPGLRRGAARRSLEPPCCRRLLPALAASPSVPARCAPQSGPWMGKCWAAAAGCGDPASSARGRTRRGRGAVGPGSGPGRVRRRGFREPRWDPRVVAEAPSAQAAPPCTRRPRHVRPSHPRGAHGEAEGSPVRPPAPGSALRAPTRGAGRPPDTSSQKMVRGSGGGGGGAWRGRAGGARPLAWEVLFTGGVGRPARVPGARPVAAEGGRPGRAALHVWAATGSRTGVPRVPGGPARSADLGCEMCYRCAPGVWT